LYHLNKLEKGYIVSDLIRNGDFSVSVSGHGWTSHECFQ